jgi:hypothetical protein
MGSTTLPILSKHPMFKMIFLANFFLALSRSPQIHYSLLVFVLNPINSLLVYFQEPASSFRAKELDNNFPPKRLPQPLESIVS